MICFGLYLKQIDVWLQEGLPVRTLKSPRCPESLGVAQRPRSPQVEATEVAFTEDFPFPAQSGRRNVGVQLSLSVASATCGKLSPSGRGGLGRRAAVSSRAGEQVPGWARGAGRRLWVPAEPA